MQAVTDEQSEKTQDNLSRLNEIQNAQDSSSDIELKAIKRMLKNLSAVEIANLIESSPPKTRQLLWSLTEVDLQGEVLQYLPEEVAAEFVQSMDVRHVANLTEALDVDDVADILQQLPDRILQEVLSAMTDQNRQRVESILSYEKDSAGGIMDTDIITVRPRFTLEVISRYLRRHDDIPPSTDQLIVVNDDNVYLGYLPISKLLTSDPAISVRELMRTDRSPIPIAMKDDEVAKLFQQNDWISAPVVNEDNQVIGRVTIDDIVDVIIEDADHSLLSFAGLDDDEDTFAPLMKTTPRRAVWLGVNLLTAILASAVIHVFQDTIDKVVALAVLMPIVASMGGIAGSQTLTVIIRGMAMGKIGASNRNWLLIREVLSSLINGLLWALVLAVITAWWFNDILMAFIIAFAILINLITSAVAGTLLPSLLRKMNIDPALAGGVALTTLTDVVGFLSFLGLATIFYA